MQGNSSISDKQTALRLAYAPASGGTASSVGNFGAALKSATAAADPTLNPSSGDSTHIVKPGDTLYGIARSRLAAVGRTEDPAASMRYALQLAQANDIRDPNRVHAGRRLNLLAVNPALTASAASADIAGKPAATAMAHPLQAPAWETRIIDEPQPDDLDALEFDVAELLPRPSPPADTQTETTKPTSGSETAVVPSAREGVSLYTQVSTAAPEPRADVPDVLYKGIVGKVLDVLPLDAATRTGLQQANAVIGSSIAARSLAALTGIGSPILTLAGLIWGIFSAQKIENMQSAESTQRNSAAPPTRPAAIASASARYDIE